MFVVDCLGHGERWWQQLLSGTVQDVISRMTGVCHSQTLLLPTRWHLLMTLSCWQVLYIMCSILHAANHCKVKCCDFYVFACMSVMTQHFEAPFTWYNLLSNNQLNVCIHDTTGCQTSLTTSCIVYTNIRPVVKPVWQPSWQPAVSCIQPVVKPVVQPGLTTGWTNSGCSFNTVVKPVVQPGSTTGLTTGCIM